MPPFRRPRNPNTTFKLVAAAFVLIFYLFWLLFHSSSSAPSEPKAKLPRPQIQHEKWRHATQSLADAPKAERVKDAMRFMYKHYRKEAWGADDILPVSAVPSKSGSGWAGFIVESASTLALMGLWDELALSVEYIISNIDFARTEQLVDPFETTVRHLGGLLSLIDLSNAGVIPESIVSSAQKNSLLRQALVLAQKLAPAYDTPTGMPWPRLNFSTNTGHPDPSTPHYSHSAIPHGRTATVLENRVLSRLTNDPTYLYNTTRAWSHLVWSPWKTDLPGLPDGPVDIFSGAPVGREKGWDNAYHSALLKACILSSGSAADRYAPVYEARWLEAAQTLRHSLVSRNAPAAAIFAPGNSADSDEQEDGYATAHLFIGRKSYDSYVNEMAPDEACAVPGNLLLGSRYIRGPANNLTTLALALLEGCHHLHTSSAVPGLAPSAWRWIPSPGTWMARNASFAPVSGGERVQVWRAGGWVPDGSSAGKGGFRLGDGTGYVESLFYAWRMMGQKRYREWAWEVFLALEKRCKTQFGFAGVKEEASRAGSGAGSTSQWVDEAEGGAVAKMLMWLWLVFSDVKVAKLEEWVFSHGGHPLWVGGV